VGRPRSTERQSGKIAPLPEERCNSAAMLSTGAARLGLSPIATALVEPRFARGMTRRVRTPSAIHPRSSRSPRSDA
jgi:hypothetical protein